VKRFRIWLLVLAVLMPIQGTVAAAMLYPQESRDSALVQMARRHGDDGPCAHHHAVAGSSAPHHDGGGPAAPDCGSCSFCSATPLVTAMPAVQSPPDATSM
jgi:hypothetical protein